MPENESACALRTLRALAADGIWILYRVIKGWLNLIDNKPMPGASNPFKT